MPLAIVDHTEPTTRAERAAMKAEALAWKKLENDNAKLRAMLQNVLDWHSVETTRLRKLELDDIRQLLDDTK